MLRILHLFGLAALLSTGLASPIASSTSAQRDDSEIFTDVNGTYHTGGLKRWAGPYDDTFVTRRANPIWTTGDVDNGGFGIQIHNVGTQTFRYYMYANGQDSSPYKYTEVAPDGVVFLSVPALFEGRLTRGNDAMNLAGVPNLLGSWFEFNVDKYNVMWGDVSLIKGCDGSITFGNTDGQGLHKGFANDIFPAAPNAAFQQRPDGQWDIGYTEAVGSIPANTVADAYELSVVGADNAYIDDAHGNPVINGLNGRMYVTMHQWQFKSSSQVGH